MKKARRRTVGLLAVSAAVALVAACGSSSSGSSSASGTSSTGGGSSSIKGKTVVLLSYENTNQWAGYFNQQFSSEIAAAGGKVQEQLTLDPATQVQQFNQAIAQHPAAIAIEIIDTTATIDSFRKAAAAHVPVVVFDGPPDPSVYNDVHSVLSNNPQLGTIAGENLVQGMQAAGMKSGNYAVLAGLESMILTKQRLNAFSAYMKKYPQYTMLQTTDTGWSSTTALTQATQLFAKYGSKLNAIYGMADYLAVPAIQAAKQVGRTPGKNVVISGGNCFKIGIQAIEAGTYYATATEDPGTLAQQTGKYVINLLSGKSVPQHTLVQEHQVTKANVSQYAAQCSHA